MSNVKNRLERVYIKLGTSCNLHCKYCHSEHKTIQFNDKILPVLKDLHLKRITFGGGEPLLYWDIIKKVVLYIGSDVQYKIVTNGTLFTQEIVDFCNRYNFLFYISVDGIGSTRDVSKPICWNLIKQLNYSGTAVTFYRENQDILKSLSSLNNIKDKYLSIKPTIWSSFPNFVHSTSKNGVLSDKDLANSYILQVTKLTEIAIQLYKKYGFMNTFLRNVFTNYVMVKDFNGIRCFNNKYVSILADGTICSCPYTLEPVGDIFHLDEIDWNQVEDTYSKESCKTCEIFNVCRNFCCVDVTENQCYVSKELYKNVSSLMDKYGITYLEFFDKVN